MGLYATHNDPPGTRTPNTLIKSQLLCQIELVGPFIKAHRVTLAQDRSQYGLLADVVTDVVMRSRRSNEFGDGLWVRPPGNTRGTLRGGAGAGLLSSSDAWLSRAKIGSPYRLDLRRYLRDPRLVPGFGRACVAGRINPAYGRASWQTAVQPKRPCRTFRERLPTCTRKSAGLCYSPCNCLQLLIRTGRSLSRFRIAYPSTQENVAWPHSPRRKEKRSVSDLFASEGDGSSSNKAQRTERGVLARKPWSRPDLVAPGRNC